ncbi:MAG: D-beta-D-heptose 1-phosphate adenylyltransferase [Alphaproteobacteria bacterium MarineAlpha5_Bin12]|nr:MAG: D-beta-D-heptose 1-phosphate adenylyltransferase [Alphaproteobacteria bacterium MarineAlpha5_Bin12]|tara:strand:+ start:10405 stop:11952 length:1548 start_codon:yes stop_codon:yes gene_type:complete
MTTEFFEKYRYKIKTKKELINIIGKIPRSKKVILCHGVFDVVHPGHIRHLAYAKTKAKILIVSITADKHIKKGIYRPHIPENLRALNLAAFEMVDYVLVDENSTPLKNLKHIKPDYFAKGFEYTSSGLPAATLEESEIVESYGGEMIFTPGDIIYSSSGLLNLSLPHLQLEKLLLLMKHNNIDFKLLKNTLNKFSKFKVHVLGDTIVDTYTRTSLIGGQTKTPTFSVLYQNEENYVGGAGIVAQHLKAAGADVTFSTILGNDNLKELVISVLKKAGIKINAIIDPTRPTTNKNVIIASEYRLLKLDKLDNRAISEEIQEKLFSIIKNSKSDAQVFSDFRHGIFNALSINNLIKAINNKAFKVADSQVATRWGNITEFKKFDLITPNEREARFAIADQDSTVGKLSGLILNASKCKNLILKLGDRGVFCATSNRNEKSSYFSIDSFVNNIVDPVGAGDALLAYSTLSMLSTKSLVISSIIGSIAAACECEHDGNIPVKPENIIEKINYLEKQTNYK